MTLFNQADFSDTRNPTSGTMNQLVTTALLFGMKHNQKRLTNSANASVPSSMPDLPLKTSKN